MLAAPIIRSAFLALLVVAASVSFSLAQEPYRPDSSDQVLETLPKNLSLNRDRMASIRQKLAEEPENSDLASAAALGYIKMGNEESDPRFFGYARSAIESWWEQELPPANVLKVRAKLKEKDHRYEDAIKDLESQLNRNPRDIQAWIEVVNLYRVIGAYDSAKESSRKLASLQDKNAVLVATTPLKAACGEAQQAYESLEAFLEASGEDSELAPWIAAMQGDISASLGKFETADRHYREALKLNSGSIHLKRTYADFLLDHGRPSPVLKLLAEHKSDNGCLLLMSIAANRLGMKKLASTLKRKMEVRFEEIRLRGNEPHGRFESRYELELNDNPTKALEIALKNWQLQKENRDARAVLESAIVANAPKAASPTIEFLKASGNEDAALTQLVRKLEQQ